MQLTKYLAGITATLALAALADPARATTTVFNDNFNRANASDLGANWTPIHNFSGGQLGIVSNKAADVNGLNNAMYVLTGLTGAYTHTTLRLDVSSGFGGQSIALNIGMNPSDTAGGLFLQTRTDATTKFTSIELDTGINMTDPNKWTTPTSLFTPTPFSTAWITARALDVDTIYVGIDSNKDGTDEESFTRNLNLANMGFGNRMGMTFSGSAGRGDDFVATVIAPANVTWNVAGGGTWDSTSNNWIGGSLHPNKYFNTDNPVFSNTAGGTITLAGGANALAIAPGSTTVNATSGTYTFAGTGITSGTLTKQGFGRLVLTNPNTSNDYVTVENAGSVAANGSTAHLTLANPTGNSLSGDLYIGVTPGPSGVAKVSLGNSNQILDTRVIYFNSGVGRFAYFSMRGNSETVAGIFSNADGGAIENGNFNGAINTNATLTLAPPAATTYTYTGIIRDADSGGGTGKLNIAVNGPGTQVLGAGGTYPYTGTTTVTAGTLTASGSLTATSGLSATGTGRLNIVGAIPAAAPISAAGGATVTFGPLTPAATRSVGAVTVGSGGVVRITSVTAPLNQPTIVQPASVSFADNTSKFDVTNNELLLSETLATLRGQITAGNIITTAVGLAVGSLDLGGGVVEARGTLLGDTNLDGTVDVTDLGNLASNYGASSNANWVNGDTNYDSAVNVTDLGNLSSTYGSSLASGPSASPAALIANVPEPTTLALLAVSALSLLGGRRCRRRSLDR